MKAAKKKSTAKKAAKAAPSKKQLPKKRALTKKKTKSMDNQTSGKKPTQTEGESVSKIRDILFGEQMANYDDRFATLEAALRSEVEALKESLTTEMRTSVADLKALVQKEKEESNDRNVARRQLADKLQKVVDDLRK
ncbi:MAG: hypothetical protein R3F19_21310 [Verrucomicrobiales bacterium]|nr:hypothetical protein [Verrucomicrobiae bacterium]